MKISLIQGGNHYLTLPVFALFYLQVFGLQEVQVPPVSFETQLIESTCEQSANPAISYRKIPEISPGAYIFQRPFLEGLIFGGAYIQRGLSTEGNLRFKIDWASLIVESKFTVFALFYFVFEGNFPSTSPRGAYIWRGDLTEGFLRYEFGGLIWRGLYMEGLIFGIVR